MLVVVVSADVSVKLVDVVSIGGVGFFIVLLLTMESSSGGDKVLVREFRKGGVGIVIVVAFKCPSPKSEIVVAFIGAVVVLKVVTLSGFTVGEVGKDDGIMGFFSLAVKYDGVRIVMKFIVCSAHSAILSGQQADKKRIKSSSTWTL